MKKPLSGWAMFWLFIGILLLVGMVLRFALVNSMVKQGLFNPTANEAK